MHYQPEFYPKYCTTKDNRFFATISNSSSHKTNNYEFILEKQTSKKLSMMKYFRRNHSFIELRLNYLLALGGGIKACEAYNILTDSWTSIAYLNLERSFFGTFTFKDRIVYAIGGQDNNHQKNEIVERIELDEKLQGKWVLFNIYSPHKNTPLLGCSCIKINDNEIFLFGGCNLKYSQMKQCMIFNTKTDTFYPSSAFIPEASSSAMVSAVYEYKGKHYIFYTNGDLSLFNGKKLVTITGFVFQEV